MNLKFSIRSLLVAFALALGLASSSFAAISWSVTIAPPALPVYEQPFSPGDDYIWTPGYWAWDASDYFWVPGTWVLAPEPGLLWTPGYWGWRDGLYVFNEGYWGTSIGFYGGVNYGFGYSGHGYDGGRWDNGHFFYNRAVTRVNETVVRNVYDAPVVNNISINRVSFNGGNGGVQSRATPEESAAARERHIAPFAAQRQHLEEARSNTQLRASVNRGVPPIAATQRPGEINGHAVIAAKEPGAERSAPVQARDIPPAVHEASPKTGSAALDERYVQQQQQMYARQASERQKLQAQQEADRQRMAKGAGEAERQALAQKHMRQTQQLMRRHLQEEQQMKAEGKRKRPEDEKRPD